VEGFWPKGLCTVDQLPLSVFLGFNDKEQLWYE
jgi:hypothetical protein